MEQTLDTPALAESPAEPVAVAFNPFKEDSWSPAPQSFQSEPIVAPQPTNTETPKPTETAPVIAPQEPTEEIFDENDYVKNRFGWDSTEVGLKELEELRKFKEKPFDFTNEDSRKAFEYLKEGKDEELYNILDQKRRVNKLLAAEKVDTNVASQMIKMGMQAKYKDLTAEEIDYKFNKQFSIPQKPTQTDIESPEEFAERLSSWEARAKEVEMDMIIEAKLAKPELEKLKSELVLPDIQRKAPEPEAPSQESLAQLQAIKDNFLKKLNSDYVNFKGFETKVKDESVELPIAFTVPDEERVAMKSFVENFEMDTYFNKRWFNEDGSPKIDKIMADQYLLENQEKVFSGIANKAASERLLHKLKENSNISLNGQQTSATFAPAENNSIQDQIAYLWKQK